jgi:hypothetical protein
MENTIVKEFIDTPCVVAAVMSQAESRATLETFWRNVYLRGPMIFDPNGYVAGTLYAQPNTGLPFGRGFVIGTDQTVVLPHFGHHPQLIIDTITELLMELPVNGDLDCSGIVDAADLELFASCLAGPDAPRPSACLAYNFRRVDLDADNDADLADFALLQALAGSP